MPDLNSWYGTKVTFDDGTTNNLAFSAPKALYDSLKTDLGLDDVTGKEIIPVPAATFCDRLGVKYDKGDGTLKYGEVWCLPSKYSGLRKTMTGTYRGKTIVDTYDPMDSSRS